MADLLVSALATTILGTLNSALLQEFGLLWGFKDDLDKLKSTFTTLQLFLQDAEIKQRKSKPLQNWLRMLKDAAYKAENILDEIATEGLRRRVESERGKLILGLKTPLMFRFKMAHRVKNIRTKIDAIAEERPDFLLGEGVLENRFGVTTEDRQTSSLPVDETEFYGRTVEKERIIKELLDNSRDEDDLSVYAIWGMGGLGKTTLAQKVYNDKRTERRFELRIWVCVSEDFGIERLLRAIIDCIGGCDRNISGLEPLQHHLRDKLKGRRFLLVLDDVWNEKHRLWDRLKEVLRCNSKGSVLVVTTRSKIVASMMATINLLQIGCLSEEDSWSLFKQRAFSSGEVGENLAAIGKEMVKKCGGVPLAIKALGRLMQFKCDESEWLSVKENENWHELDDENNVLPILRLSYDNLPVQMRQCFGYCSLFPKDYEMEVDKLIQLWMANGFVVLTEGQTDLPHAGHLIYKELVRRTFLQDEKYEYRDGYGGYMIKRTCKMHDLMHDLAESVMGHENRIVERGGEPKIPMHWYCSREAVVRNKSEIKFPTDGSLRSLIVEDEFDQKIKGFSSLLSKQQYLRALHLTSFITYKLPNFPNFVWKLKHLRYLRMSCDGMRSLSESVTHLCNLQTLKLMDSWDLVELPKDLRVMKNLWFLEIEDTERLRCTPPGLRDLTHLRGLSIFIVGEEASQQIEQLKELNLGGKLTLRGLENVRNLEDARSANLITKRDLTSLDLIWPTDITNDSADHYEEVLQGLQPHQNLEYISICGYRGSGLPNWVTPLDLKNLKAIVLEDCVKIVHLPPMGNLPCLAEVSLEGMHSVKRLGAEWHGDREDSFPALIKLTIKDMPNLEDWSFPDSAESFPRLNDLQVVGCPKLSKLPILPTGLKSLRLSELPIRRVSNLLDNPSSLSSLEYFLLSKCGNLEFVAERFRHLKSLVQISITECDGLTSFPANILEDLPSLNHLFLCKCKNLRPLSGPLEGATTLLNLKISGLPELQHLPESMQQLTSLRSLMILDCDGLCTLPDWLGSLHSLYYLHIANCSNLNSLPDGLRNLNSLRSLQISHCPQLEERCKKPRGEDWHKISHIPSIEINNERPGCFKFQAFAPCGGSSLCT